MAKPSEPALLVSLSVEARGLLARGKGGGWDPQKRIADIQERLKPLLERLRSASLFGDRQTIAALAKEASGLAKDLGNVLREAVQEGRVEGAEAVPGEAGLPIPASPMPLDDGLVTAATRAMEGLRIVLTIAEGLLRRRDGKGEDQLGDSSPEGSALANLSAGGKALMEAAATLQITRLPPGATH